MSYLKKHWFPLFLCFCIAVVAIYISVFPQIKKSVYGIYYNKSGKAAYLTENGNLVRIPTIFCDSYGNTFYCNNSNDRIYFEEYYVDPDTNDSVRITQNTYEKQNILYLLFGDDQNYRDAVPLMFNIISILAVYVMVKSELNFEMD